MRSYNHLEWCNQNFIFFEATGGFTIPKREGGKKERIKGKKKKEKKSLWFELHIWTSYETYITKSKILEN